MVRTTAKKKNSKSTVAVTKKKKKVAKKKKATSKKPAAKRKTSKPKTKVKAKSKSKNPVGRPQTEFSEEVKKNIEKYASMGCQTETIAAALGIPATTLRSNFGGVLKKKRAERKIWLRTIQSNRAKNDKSPTMAIFLGKNELDQDDNQTQVVMPELPPINITVTSGKK